MLENVFSSPWLLYPSRALVGMRLVPERTAVGDFGWNDAKYSWYFLSASGDSMNGSLLVGDMSRVGRVLYDSISVHTLPIELGVGDMFPNSGIEGRRHFKLAIAGGLVGVHLSMVGVPQRGEALLEGCGDSS